MLNKKFINAGLILLSLTGYLEWGGTHSAFLFEAEAEVLKKLFLHPVEVLHPFTVLPLMGQLLLIYSLFQNPPGKKLTLTGMLLIGLLMLFIFFIGLISLNFKIAASALPFLLLSVFAIKRYRETAN